MEISALGGLALFQSGDDLAAEIQRAMDRARLSFEEGDIVVIAQKVVSKCEGRKLALSHMQPSERAVGLAAQVKKDPSYVEAVLSESRTVVQAKQDVLITEHRLGHIMAKRPTENYVE